MGWSKTAPSGISFSSSTEKTGSQQWNWGGLDIKVRTARGTGDTYYVRVYVKYEYGQGGAYQKTTIYYRIGSSSSDQHGYNMADVGTSDTFYFTGSRGSSGSVRVRACPNSDMSGDKVDITSASIPAASYTVSYSGNGSTSGSVSSHSKTYGVGFTTATNGYIKTGYTFTNWNTAANGSGTSYAAGTFYSNFPDRSLTLYAQWSINTYTISYNANGGSGAPGSQTKTYGVNLTLSTTVPTRTGYTFLGWSTSSTATTATYAAGGTFSTNANTTLYAVWKINTWTVSYNGNGNTGGSTASQTKTYNVALSISSNGFTRTNYSFVTWNTKADGSGTNYAPGDSYTGNAGMTLYAIWKKNNIPVFVNKDGTIYQVEKAYANVGGVIKECTVYANVGGIIKIFS